MATLNRNALDDVLDRQKAAEFEQALRALLMQPLLPASHAAYALVRRHLAPLREWLARETGWTLLVERECARLYKRPGALDDATRGAAGFDGALARERYVLLCLVCAVLERAEPQITLRVLGERVLEAALDDELATQGFRFTLEAARERRDLVHVCRYLLQHGVLSLVAGDVHDAHALDPGRRLAALVLRAAETADAPITEDAMDGTSAPLEETRLRNRWARLGIAVNEFASPVLCLNLDASANSVAGRLLACAREAGEPLHLSLSLLLRAPPRWQLGGRSVFVCENPAIVALAAQGLGKNSAPLVSTDGMPAAAQRSLFDQLSSAGATLRYHGDFDWPGITIGNFMIRRFKAQPWRFSASDYRGHSGKALGPGSVAASWDTQLSQAMLTQGYCLHEESVADTLLQDLAS